MEERVEKVALVRPALAHDDIFFCGVLVCCHVVEAGFGCQEERVEESAQVVRRTGET